MVAILARIVYDELVQERASILNVRQTENFTVRICLINMTDNVIAALDITIKQVED